MYSGTHMKNAQVALACVIAEARDRIRCLHEERGGTMAEYGLLLGFVAVVVFGGLALFGPAVVDLFTDTHDEFSARGNPAP